MMVEQYLFYCMDHNLFQMFILSLGWIQPFFGEKGAVVVSDIYPTKRKNVFTLCGGSYDLKGISVTTYVQIIL
jgi:hypothetical protein